jgi:hypothetical protein
MSVDLPAASVPCPDIEPLAQRLRGHRLPGGRYEITAADTNIVAQLTGLTSSVPHPIFASIAALRSLGVSIGDLCALCEFRLDDGPMLGEISLQFFSPMHAGVQYEVSAEIESLDRTVSRRLGILDRLQFVVRLVEHRVGAVAEVHFLWLLPRGKRANA